MPKPTIIYAEDENDLRDRMKIQLEREGYTVRAHADGASALHDITQLRQTDAQAPLFLLTDFNMLNMDGVQLIKNIAALGIKIPTIMMSGREDVAKSQLDEMGANVEVMTKPVSMYLLLYQIGAAWAKHQHINSGISTHAPNRSSIEGEGR